MALFACLLAVAMNPVLPHWECVPDVEPRVFGDRLYVYGSHDRANAWDFCLDDYVCWSAPVDRLDDWRCEGVIFAKRDDPENREDGNQLYAPDAVRGSDGRYYLYYQRDTPNGTDGQAHLGVAVCDRPSGRFEFLGYVRRKDGVLLGDKAGDNGFDPSVLVEENAVWLYCGFAASGCRAYRLASDMLTILEDGKEVIPPPARASGTSFEGHAFFEASSARKIDGKYVLVYSDQTFSALGYAVSDGPQGPFEYQGTLVRNAGGNNHGGLVRLGDSWWIFYHRHTNGTSFSRKCCAERLERDGAGRFLQAEMTSQGLAGRPLPANGTYPASSACEFSGAARIEQLGEGPSADVFVGHVSKGASLGFRYFDCRQVVRVGVEMRGWSAGFVEVSLGKGLPPIGRIPVARSQNWKTFFADIHIPDGRQSLYFTFSCNCLCGLPQVKSICFRCAADPRTAKPTTNGQ